MVYHPNWEKQLKQINGEINALETKIENQEHLAAKIKETIDSFQAVERHFHLDLEIVLHRVEQIRELQAFLQSPSTGKYGITEDDYIKGYGLVKSKMQRIRALIEHHRKWANTTITMMIKNDTVKSKGLFGLIRNKSRQGVREGNIRKKIITHLKKQVSKHAIEKPMLDSRVWYYARKRNLESGDMIATNIILQPTKAGVKRIPTGKPNSWKVEITSSDKLETRRLNSYIQGRFAGFYEGNLVISQKGAKILVPLEDKPEKNPGYQPIVVGSYASASRRKSRGSTAISNMRSRAPRTMKISMPGNL